MSVVGVLSLVKYVVAGLDFRFGWSTGIMPALQFAALVVAVGGYALGTWAMAVNAYFSLVVRIQHDRGQKVVSDGPYRWVRHPGYVGTILFELAAPLLLGSWWALVPGVISALLLVVRTALEDRTLQQELDGYKQYAGEVRYRLLPGVW
jgi:protein-S-isoprenylcysteine O-methyltransferase Ste14